MIAKQENYIAGIYSRLSSDDGQLEESDSIVKYRKHCSPNTVRNRDSPSMYTAMTDGREPVLIAQLSNGCSDCSKIFFPQCLQNDRTKQMQDIICFVLIFYVILS